MDWDAGILVLRSGRWGRRLDTAPSNEALELYDPRSPANKMRVPLPFSWRQMPEESIRELARDPELRLWLDEFGILWRVAVVGPGTRYEYPLQRCYLVFDSESAWAGIVEMPEGALLGDLTDAELKELRDGIGDFGGRRQGFRAPARTDPRPLRTPASPPAAPARQPAAPARPRLPTLHQTEAPPPRG